MIEPGFGRKPFRKSALRQSLNFDDEQSGHSSSEQPPLPDEPLPPLPNEPLPVEPVPHTRPAIGRTLSLNKKKKTTSSRLSFGPGEIISGDAAEALEDDAVFTPRKSTLGRRVIETNAARNSLPSYSLPLRNDEDEADRPTYSKDYLNELKSSTPNTPKNVRDLDVQMEDEEGLDASELEGAMIVDLETPAVIPTDAEVQEKKERRARLAREQDFISLDDRGDNDIYISLLPRKKKADSRLVREDEDMAEGFEQFVDDGRRSLGRKAEREAKRKQRKAMADMIHDAEGSSSDDSDDSEKERMAQYEAAQTRAGMDGLQRNEEHQRAAAAIPPKITPIPKLDECLARLQSTLSGMEMELNRRKKKMEELEAEKAAILLREEEVQRLLKEAGERYSAIRAESGLPALDAKALTEGPGILDDAMLRNSRGLESFGNTPIANRQVEDIG